MCEMPPILLRHGRDFGLCFWGPPTSVVVVRVSPMTGYRRNRNPGRTDSLHAMGDQRRLPDREIGHETRMRRSSAAGNLTYQLRVERAAGTGRRGSP